MSAPYTGNPAAAESPAIAPNWGVAPIYTLPADGDALNAASVAQAFKTSADYSAFLTINGTPGIAFNGPTMTAYGDTAPSASYAWCPNSMQGYALPGGSALQTTNAAGLIAQYVSGKMLYYTMSADDLLTTHDAGSVNNRWDGIFIKLSQSASSAAVTLTKSVVKGSTAAHPLYPSTPAGYVPFAYVYISTTESGTLDYDKIGDARIPMRFGSCTVYAAEMAIGPDADNYTLNATRVYMEQGVGALQDLYAYFPGDMSSRILRVTVDGEFTAGGAQITGQVRRYDLRALSIGNPGAIGLSQFAIASGVTAQSLLSPASSTGNGGPVWGCSKPAGPGYVASISGQAIQYRTCVDVSTDGSPSVNRVTLVRFDYAY